MNFGIASRLLWSYPLSDVIAIAERLHYDGVEIWAEHYIRDRGKKAEMHCVNHPLYLPFTPFPSTSI